MRKLNKKAEGNSGIDTFGVLIALFLFFLIRGWFISGEQQEINEFCIGNGFNYGEERIIDTLIICENYDNNNKSKFSNGYYESYKRGEEE